MAGWGPAPVDKAKFVEWFQALSSRDNAIRQKAETMYQQAKKSDPDNLVIGMLAMLSYVDVEESLRIHMAVLLRQLTSKGPEKDFAFARITPQHQQEVAAELLRRFELEAAPLLQKKIGDIISKLAEYVCDKDDPRGSLAPGDPTGWPGLLPLLFRMADASSCSSVEACECAIRLLKDIVSTLKDDVVQAQQQLGQIIQSGMSHASLKLRTASVLLVCQIVVDTEKSSWAPLLQTVAVMVQVLTQLVQAGEEDLLQEAIQALTDVTTVEPEFFKAQLSQNLEPAKFMAAVARSREGVENGVRNLAFEWLVSYLEKRVKWLTRHLEQYNGLVLETCMQYLCGVDDGEDALKAWASRMDDEEGEEDEDELFHIGSEAIDRIGTVLPMMALGPVLFPMVGRYAEQDSWQAKLAALAAIKQTAEYVEEQSHIDEMTRLCLQHLDHPHPRVRYTALHAVGQMANDQSPTFQEAWHKTVMPMLLKMMDDPIDRVAAMAMSALVSFGEDLDTSLMRGYAQSFMQKIVAKLQATQHRGVREESITSIAVIAGVLEKEFSQYYDDIMPMLKQFVMHATSDKENRLRGKSFECMSLLGIAVGKEKFLPDAKEAIAEMLKTNMNPDDVQREYIKEASERICQCLKRDFAPFLQTLLPGLLRSLKFEEVAAGSAHAEIPGDEADLYVKVSTGDGSLVRVHTQKFEEMKQSIQLLLTFCTEMGGAYFDCVQPTAEVLLPLLSNKDEEFRLYCEEVRGLCLQAWGLLIKVARSGADERGLAPTLAQELFSTGLRLTFAILEKTKQPDTLAETACGITQSIKHVGRGIIQGPEVSQIVDKMLALTDQSLERTRCAESRKSAQIANLPSELVDAEEDDVDWELGEEEQLRRNYEEILGAVMEVSAEHFLPCVPRCAERIGLWLQTKQNKVLGLYLACDLLMHLREKSETAWPVFMPEVFRSLHGGECPDARTAAAYAINMAAPLQSFNEASPVAFSKLAPIVGGPRPKKRDVKGKLAFDNAVAALFALAKEKPGFCPPDIKCWPLLLAKLPIRDDEDEAKKLHGKFVDLVLAQDQGLLGGPGRENLGPVLSVLAEVYHVEAICSKETEEKILKVFKLLPRDMLQHCAAGFSEKQQKKIEQMLLS